PVGQRTGVEERRAGEHAVAEQVEGDADDGDARCREGCVPPGAHGPGTSTRVPSPATTIGGPHGSDGASSWEAPSTTVTAGTSTASSRLHSGKANTSPVDG